MVVEVQLIEIDEKVLNETIDDQVEVHIIQVDEVELDELDKTILDMVVYELTAVYQELVTIGVEVEVELDTQTLLVIEVMVEVEVEHQMLLEVTVTINEKMLKSELQVIGQIKKVEMLERILEVDEVEVHITNIQIMVVNDEEVQ